MRNLQHLYARHRIGVTTPIFAKGDYGPASAAGEDWKIAAKGAIAHIGHIAEGQGFHHPVTLSKDEISSYALALLSLRECASAAGFERLTNACDALAVTVSRLLEDRTCATHDKCAALRLFVAHAQSMIQGTNGRMRCYDLPSCDIPNYDISKYAEPNYKPSNRSAPSPDASSAIDRANLKQKLRRLK